MRLIYNNIDNVKKNPDNTTYNVYIDRRRITKAGSVVSFEGLLKNYSPEEIQIRYDMKEQKMPSLSIYRDNKTK